MKRKIFFTSDWHIGRENVIRFSNRPFENCDAMHEGLIRNYNRIVPKHGICYFLGDMAMVGSSEVRNVIDRLNGTKVLVMGNHDRGANYSYNCGFDVVLYGATLVVANRIVTMNHCPLLGLYREDTASMSRGNPDENWHGELNPKRKIFTRQDYGQYHLHGHIHSPNGGKSKKIEGKQFDVGVDANNYRPVSISEIESWIVTCEQTK